MEQPVPLAKPEPAPLPPLNEGRRRRSRLIIAAVLLAVLVLGGGAAVLFTRILSEDQASERTAEEPAFASPIPTAEDVVVQDLIVFSRPESGSEDIYLLNRDSGEEVRLSTDGASTNPAWSPDGSKIVFERATGTVGDQTPVRKGLSIMNADGTGVVELTTGEDSSPVWSPDGDRIAFSRGSLGDAEVYVVNSDGTGLTRVTTDSYAPTFVGSIQPSWLPDGDRIAYAPLALTVHPESEP